MNTPAFKMVCSECGCDHIGQTIKTELEATREVVGWAQALLTALNVGDVQSGSRIHLKLREVMIAYRAAIASDPPKSEPEEYQKELRRLIPLTQAMLESLRRPAHELQPYDVFSKEWKRTAKEILDALGVPTPEGA